MILLGSFVMVSLFTVTLASDSPPDQYSFKFPERGRANRALIKNFTMPSNTRNISISMWAKINKQMRFRQFLHYDSGNLKCYITLETTYDGFYFLVGGGFGGNIRLVLNDNETFHFVLTWQSEGPHLKFYFNGKDTLLSGDNYYLLGSFQMSSGANLYVGNQGRYEFRSFDGEITGVNIWDRVLTAEEAKEVYESKLEGNILAWSKTVWELENDVEIVTPSIGKIPNCPKALKL